MLVKASVLMTGETVTDCDDDESGDEEDSSNDDDDESQEDESSNADDKDPSEDINPNVKKRRKMVVAEVDAGPIVPEEDNEGEVDEGLKKLTARKQLQNA